MSPRPLLLKSGRIFDPSQNLDLQGDLYIRNGKIESIAHSIPLTRETGALVVDCTGFIISPGWIDMHTHLREPGQSHKETIKTGTEAAAAGGFTSVACMANTNPVNDNAFITSYIYQKASSDSEVNVYAIGAITKGLKGEELAEIGAMYEAGIVGLSDDGKTVMDSYLMRKALDYAKRFNLVVISHAEDTCLKGRGVMNEGFNSSRFGLRGIPKASEEIIVARDILLAELTNSRLHIAHASTAGTVNLIREAKRRGVQVTAEVTAHHLVLTDDAVSNYDTNTKVAPPLREVSDLDALAEGLKDGTIDVLASDHAPHSVEDKEIEYDLAEFGMVGLETAFSLYHRVCLEKGISLSKMISAMTKKPADILGIPKGTLGIGADADLTVFDPQTKIRIDKNKFRSKSRNTPFHGHEGQGEVIYTISGGKIVHRSQSMAKPAVNGEGTSL